MFKRLIYEEWHEWVPIAAFLLTALAFLILVGRALIMKREKAERLAGLPLQGDSHPAPNAEESDAIDECNRTDEQEI